MTTTAEVAAAAAAVVMTATKGFMFTHDLSWLQTLPIFR